MRLAVELYPGLLSMLPMPGRDASEPLLATGAFDFVASSSRPRANFAFLSLCPREKQGRFIELVDQELARTRRDSAPGAAEAQSLLPSHSQPCVSNVDRL